jgi:hypothetical protein
MTIAQLTRRLRGAWNHIAASIDKVILTMALEALTALVATAQGAAGRIIAKAQGDAGALADAQSQIANLEQDAIAAVQPLADQLTQADPSPPAPVDPNAPPPSGV